MIGGKSLVSAPVVLALALAANGLHATAAMSQSNPGQDVTDLSLLALIGFVALIVFLLPTIVAFMRGHPNRWPIMLINLVFGLTVLGWFGTLIWAMGAVHKSPTGSNGGESGLNLFVNDPQAIRIASSPETPSEAQQLTERLHNLKQLEVDGAISAEEHQQLRGSLLDGFGRTQRGA